jgi:hypothetical protein
VDPPRVLATAYSANPFPVLAHTGSLLVGCRSLLESFGDFHTVSASCGPASHSCIIFAELFRYPFSSSACKVSVIKPYFVQVLLCGKVSRNKPRYGAQFVPAH